MPEIIATYQTLAAIVGVLLVVAYVCAPLILISQLSTLNATNKAIRDELRGARIELENERANRAETERAVPSERPRRRADDPPLGEIHTLDPRRE